MSILAVIPARASSKRLPGKNSIKINGKSLFERAIESAIGIEEISHILVSTDDDELINQAKKYDVLIPWKRPPSLCEDFSTSVEVVLHAVNWYEKKFNKVDGVILLQPTSPFRSNELIREGINLFYRNHFAPVVSVVAVNEHPMWCFKKSKTNHLEPFCEKNGFGIRSQDLPEVYIDAGSVYIISPDMLKKNRSFIGQKTVGLFVKHFWEAIDIDTEWDLEIAKLANAIYQEN